MIKKVAKLIIVFFVVGLFCYEGASRLLADTDYTGFQHIITLYPGWNIVSSPRVLDSHLFSAAETSNNFDIYLLDNTKPSGYSTMQEAGQAEFTPLFGYLINNKTGVAQSLTFNYKKDTEPAKRLFSRQINIGWSLIGIANPDYAAKAESANDYNVDNIKNILSSGEGCVDTIVDMTDGENFRSFVHVSSKWKSRTWASANDLSDFRETKAYAIYSTCAFNYKGTQDNDKIELSDSDNSIDYNENHYIAVSFDSAATPASGIKKNTTKVPFATFNIKAESNANIENLPIVITMSTSSALMKLANVVMVDSTNNLTYSATDPIGGTMSEKVTFQNVNLSKDVQYRFIIKGDVPDDINDLFEGMTYKASFTTEGLNGTYVDTEENINSSDFSAQTIEGNTMTVSLPKVTFSKVVINNAIVTKGTAGVLLYEGKITANNVDDLRISRIKATSTLTGTFASNGNMSASFDRMTLYKVNSDGTETSLNTLTSLSGATLTFSGFTLSVPKGISNSVYFRIRGDVKSSPATGTISMAIGYNKSSDHTVRDSDSNALNDFQYSSIDSATNGVVTIGGTGTYTAAFEFGENGTNQDNYVLAGSKTLVGRMKFTASNETAKVVDLAFKNNPASSAANPSDVATFYAYKESTMTTLLGTATMGDDYFIKFENLNFEVPTTGTTYLYIAAQYKGIDYSANPISSYTAATAKKVQLYATSTATYTTKVAGKSTGDTLTNPYWGGSTTDKSKVMTTTGALVSGVTTLFANATLSNGVSKKVFSFKVTAPSQNSNNIDYDGSALSVNLASTTFGISTSTGIALSNIKIQRVGGAYGKVAAKVGNTNSVVSWGILNIDFPSTYGVNAADLNIRPGETAEYEIYADISGSNGSGDSLQVYVNDISLLKYSHHTGTSGVQGANSQLMYPIITGVTDIVGGQLSN